MDDWNVPSTESDSLYDSLRNVSVFPLEPFRSWVLPGCRFSKLECWQYADPQHNFFGCSQLLADGASEWLQKHPNTTNVESCIHGIKVLIVEGTAPREAERKTANIDSEVAILNQAVRSFRLDPAALDLFGLELNEPACDELLKISSVSGDAPTMYLSFPYHALVWRWDAEASCIYAILLGDVENLLLAEALRYWVHRYQNHLDNPYILPYLILFLAIDQQGTMLQDAHWEILKVETQTGFANWDRSPKIDRAMPEEIPGLSARVSGIAANGSARRTDSLHLLSSLQSISKEIEKHISMSDRKDAVYKTRQSQLSGCLLALKGILNTQFRMSEEIRDRAIVQQSALFNLISQQDQKSNLEVARASRVLAVQTKNDSQSMKTIAFMTMIFLPGTFVATIFAMPIFNWNARKVISWPFWTYWAVTLPLTLLVLFLAWGLQNYLKWRRDNKPKKRIRDVEEKDGTEKC